MEKAADSPSPEVEKDMMTMFASVWVKVEVDECDEEEKFISLDKDGLEINTKKSKRKREYSKTFKCSECDYTTIYKNCLNLHILGHSPNKPFSCQYCAYSTKYTTSLQRHMHFHHKEQTVGQIDPKYTKEYKCEQCDYVSLYKWNLQSHKRKHKLDKMFKCKKCSYETAYRHNYIKHSKVHNEETCYRCDKCEFTTRFEGHITRHLAKIHNEVTEKANKCDLCDFSTQTKWRLKIHKKRGKRDVGIKCEYCGYESFYMCEYKKHKQIHYKNDFNEDDKRKDFKVTEKEIQNSYNETYLPDAGDMTEQNYEYHLDPDCLDWHNIQILESENKDKPFLCHLCSYASRFKSSVQRHFQRHHTGSNNRPYKCVKCNFSTKTKDQIALHNKRSQSELIICCKSCPFQTFYKCQYVLHQKVHYTFKCTKCDYTCRQKHELQRHYAVHNGAGIKCRYCDYQAARKDSVLSHETIHTGVKPYKCVHCKYTSVRKAYVDKHLRVYHSDLENNVTIISSDKINDLKVPITDRLDLNLNV